MCLKRETFFRIIWTFIKKFLWRLLSKIHGKNYDNKRFYCWYFLFLQLKFINDAHRNVFYLLKLSQIKYGNCPMFISYVLYHYKLLIIKKMFGIFSEENFFLIKVNSRFQTKRIRYSLFEEFFPSEKHLT